MWQPIETAPKNGKLQTNGPFILVAQKRPRAAQHYTDGKSWNIYAAAWNNVQKKWLALCNGCFVLDGFLEKNVNPTHWMPLPEPPETNND